MRNVEIPTVFYRTDPEAAAQLVPPPLAADGDVVIVRVYHMPDADGLGDYLGCPQTSSPTATAPSLPR
jgi:acetoacetate decarboxylase